MKKYLPYIGITLVLLIVALYHLFQDTSRTLEIDSRYFAVQDTSEITQIEVTTNNDTILFQKSAENWVVNRKYPAKSKVMRTLLGMFSIIEVQEPIPGEIKQEIMKEISLHSLHISFRNNKKILKAFRIFDNDTLNLGTFALMDGNDEPYIIRIPGFNGRISKLFPTNPLIWRENVVFRYQPYEILDISVEYPMKPEKSFKMDLKDPAEIKILSLTGTASQVIRKDDAVKYLYNFSTIGFDPLLRNNYKELYDSLTNTSPLCIITVNDVSGNTNIIRTFPLPTGKRNKKFDMYKMYAVIQNDSMPVLVKYVDYDPIMKELSDFLTK
jgi:hypothetical protein